MQLIGPGEQYQSQLELANQSLTRVAGHVTGHNEGASQTLQLVDGLLVVYSGSIGRAYASFRQDARNPLGIMDLWDSSRLLYAPGSGILAQLDALAGQERSALTRALSTGWMSTPALLLWIVPIAALFGLLLFAQGYLRWRFRRTVNLALLAATVLLMLVPAATATVLVSRSRADTAVDTLNQVSEQWRVQTVAGAATDRHALGEMFRNRCAGAGQGGCGDTVNAFLAGLSPTTGAAPSTAERGPAGAKQVNKGLGSAEMSGVLGYLIPLGTAAVAVLILFGLQGRLDEYRYRST